MCNRYGDGFDIQQQIDDVIGHIKRQTETYFLKEIDPDYPIRDDVCLDDRVDVCLYFIPPHRLKELDLLYMKRLSEVVAVIPVIAKADTMTEVELKEFKALILDKCASDMTITLRSPHMTLTDAIKRVFNCLRSTRKHCSELGTRSTLRFIPLQLYQVENLTPV